MKGRSVAAFWLLVLARVMAQAPEEAKEPAQPQKPADPSKWLALGSIPMQRITTPINVTNTEHVQPKSGTAAKPIKFETDFRGTTFADDKGSYYNSQRFSQPLPYAYSDPVAPTHYISAGGSYDTSYSAVEAPSTSKYSPKESLPSLTSTTSKFGAVGGASPWTKILNVLAAFIPIGLFLAALPPNVLSVNSTPVTTPGRQRSEDGSNEPEPQVTYPILELIEKFGFAALEDPVCENRIFCEMARMGELSEANIVQKSFWYMANETPDTMAEMVDMKEVFKAIRTGTCDMYQCKKKKAS